LITNDFRKRLDGNTVPAKPTPMCEIVLRANLESYQSNPECVLHTFGHCEASNLRDHIYAFLGMSNCLTQIGTSTVQGQDTDRSVPTR